ncbi:MAG TPA: phosphodiester glycosidase family protein [Patescibacteria group bacterium]
MKTFKRLLLLAFFLLFILILFIKFDTPAAAEFTDNVLRPLFGNQAVVFVEKIFYNLSDKAQQLTSHDNLISPQFIEDSSSATISASRLNINPISQHYFPLSKNENVWKYKSLKLFPNEGVMAYTYVRPDPDRPYASVTIIQIDMKAIRMSTVAGKKEPAGKVGKPGPGVIPQDIIDSNNLVAAFDGGFQYRDGQYGMVVGDTTYLPLKPDLGTLVGYNDGTLKIINYSGQDLGNNVEFIRQNCPILINNGEMSVLNPKNKSLWGRTLTSDIYTWRSGVGLTAEGNLLFAVGNNLTPVTLAQALKMAGANSAIQLDINPYWVRFNFFDPQGNGKYQSSTLTKQLFDGSKQYLSGYNKDFFYLYKK